MAKATTTIKQSLGYKSAHASYFVATKILFNQLCAFYFEVIAAHPALLDLSSKEALTALEVLTHATKDRPHPIMPLSDTVIADIPAMFRRAAIHAALGSACSFYHHLDKWCKQKEQAVAKGKKFTVRPPVPPRSWNKSVTLYAGQWKGRTNKSIMLKLWMGRSWVWIKCKLKGRDLPDGWEMGSPMLVENAGRWYLHIPVKKKFTAPAKAADLMSGKASHSSASCGEARQSGRCSPFPGRQRPRKTIYQPCQAWNRERAGHRAREGVQDGGHPFRYFLPTTAVQRVVAMLQ